MVEQRLEPMDRVLDRVVSEPRPRGVSAPAVEDEPRDDVSEAARLDRPVRGFEDDRERDLCTRRGDEESGEGVLIARELLAAEEEESDVESLGRRSARSATSSSATARPPFMSLAPSP